MAEKDSLAARERSYMGTFDGEVVFEPLANVSVDEIEAIEDAIKEEMLKQYKRVGRAREWFHTTIEMRYGKLYGSC